MFGFGLVTVSAVVTSVVVDSSVVELTELGVVIGLGLKFLGGLLNLGLCMEGWITVLSRGRLGFLGGGPL